MQADPVYLHIVTLMNLYTACSPCMTPAPAYSPLPTPPETASSTPIRHIPLIHLQLDFPSKGPGIHSEIVLVKGLSFNNAPAYPRTPVPPIRPAESRPPTADS